MADLNVVYKIAADISGLQDGVNRAAASTERLEGTVASVGKTLLGAFTATALVSGMQRLVSESLKYADALSNLNARTGVSIAGLQRLESIGASSGVSMESLAKSVTLLHKNLDSPAAMKALAEMGMSYAQIRALNPEQQFIEIAKSLAKIDDPIKKANAGTALFGKTWDLVAGAFEGDVDKIVAGATIIDTAQIKALDRAGDAWDQWTLNVGRSVKGYLGEIVLAQQETKSWADSLGVLGHAWAELRRQTTVGALPTVKAPGMPTGAGPSVDVDIAQVIKESNEQIEASIRKRQKAEEEAAEATKRAAKEMDESLERMRFGYFSLGQAALTATQNVAGFGIKTSEVLTIGNDYSKTLIEAQIKTDAFGHVLQTNVLPSLEGLGGALEQSYLRQAANTVATDDWRASLSTLASSFVQLSQISQNAFSGVAKGIGMAISSLNVALDSVDTLKSGFGSLGSGSTLKGIASIASGIGGIVSVASTAIAAVKALWNWAKGGEEGTVVNPARDSWFSGRTVDDIGDQLADVGIDRDTARQMIQRVFDARKKGDFDQATAAIDSLLGGGVPRFARGGLVTQPTFAMVGESGPELITPLDRLGDLGNAREISALSDEVLGLRYDLNRMLRAMPRLSAVAWKDAMAH